MSNRTTLADILGAECSAPDCSAKSLDDAPLPICERHYIDVIRHYHQLTRGSGLVADQYDEVAGFGEVPREPTGQTVPEFVYFIRFRDLVKIGTTTNVPKRLAGLPMDELLAVIPGGRSIERQWHERFYQHRERGEWFRTTEQMLAEIKALGTCA